MRYQFIKDQVEKAYPVTLLCQVMRVHRSNYYQWLYGGKSQRQIANEELLPLVMQVHLESGQSYGSRRMAKALQALGVSCGRCRARTLMRMAGISVKSKKKFKVTTDSKHKMPVADNILDRKFQVLAPNQVWVSDITYIWTMEGWLYLAVIIDLFSRKVVGWSISSRINKELVKQALRMAFWHRKPGKGLLFHSDRGSQYCSNDFQKQLKGYGMICSMSRKGNCWDNAVSESFFASLKKERIFHKTYQTREEARKDIVSYIEMFYNSKRLHSYIGYKSPMEFEKAQTLKKVAGGCH